MREFVQPNVGRWLARSITQPLKGWWAGLA